MKKNCQKYGLLVIIALLIPLMAHFYTLFFSEIKTYDNDLNKSLSSSSSGWSGGIYLYYDEYYSVYGYAENKIEWSFTGDPVNINIILIILEEDLYNTFIIYEQDYGLNITTQYFLNSVVSDNTSSNSGIYYPYQNSNWYIIFINLDEDQLVSSVDFDVDFDQYDYNHIYSNPFIFIYIIYAIVISLVIIIIVIQLIRKKSKISKGRLPYTYPYPSKEQKLISNSYLQYEQKNFRNNQQVESTIDKSYQQEKLRVNYCQFCGSIIDRDAIFCHQCGSKLDI